MGQVVLPSARLFIGPGHGLSGFDRIWVSIHGGRHLVIGRNGDEAQDLKLLSYVFGRDSKGAAAAALTYYLYNGHLQSAIMPSNEYHKTPHPHAALKGDSPLVWTVDFDQSRVFYDRDGMHLLYDFSVPDGRPLRIRHFKPYTAMQLPMKPLNPSAAMCSQISAPPDTIPPQLFDLVYRLVSDYEHNWQTKKFTIEHYGLQHIANGILSCFTLNFKTEKISANTLQHKPYFLNRVNKDNLLRWRVWPFPPVVPTVSLGDTHILFIERMDEAKMLVDEHFASERLPRCHSEIHTCATAQYVITSIREIQYFRKTCDTVSCTPVSPFFNGQDPPSKTGVRWMLNAIHGHAYPLHAPIHDLPVELQEMILDFASDGNEIDRAVYASVLGIGVPFEWKEGTLPLKLCQLSRNRKLDESKLEHQIVFWNDYVAMSYQARSSHSAAETEGECTLL